MSVEYVLAHRTAPPVVGLAVMGADFGNGAGPAPTPQEQCESLTRVASASLKVARTLDADWAPGTLETADAALDAALAYWVGEPSPAPETALPPLAAGAIYGQTKWLPGSLGVDMFCRRGDPVMAPLDCVIREVLGGTGQQGGAEIILATPDNAWAWRWRHVQAQGVRVGDRVARGQVCAVVYDPSLDQLCTPPVAGFPDLWQHCDLSVNRGTDRFSPQGGGGGNVSAYEWLQSIGYVGTVVARTPGPTSCGWTMAHAERWVRQAIGR